MRPRCHVPRSPLLPQDPLRPLGSTGSVPRPPRAGQVAPSAWTSTIDALPRCLPRDRVSRQPSGAAIPTRPARQRVRPPDRRPALPRGGRRGSDAENRFGDLSLALPDRGQAVTCGGIDDRYFRSRSQGASEGNCEMLKIQSHACGILHVESALTPRLAA
jgi:hypothetical protein